MIVATWNVNHRVGRTPYHPEAAAACRELRADVVVLTEYFPQSEHEQFVADLASGSGGFPFIRISQSPLGDRRPNRVMIASKELLAPLAGIRSPGFDDTFRYNLLGVEVPSAGLKILGVRVPYYSLREEAEMLRQTWKWLSSAAARLRHDAALILGDLNVYDSKKSKRGGEQFRKLQAGGWKRAIGDSVGAPGTCFSKRGSWTEIDHVLATESCTLSKARYVSNIGGYELAGSAKALSDHAAVVVECKIA